MISLYQKHKQCLVKCVFLAITENSEAVICTRCSARVLAVVET